MEGSKVKGVRVSKAARADTEEKSLKISDLDSRNL